MLVIEDRGKTNFTLSLKMEMFSCFSSVSSVISVSCLCSCGRQHGGVSDLGGATVHSEVRAGRPEGAAGPEDTGSA